MTTPTTQDQQRARQTWESIHTALSFCYCCANDGESYVAGRPVTNCAHRRKADAIIGAAFSAVRAEQAAIDAARIAFLERKVATREQHITQLVAEKAEQSARIQTVEQALRAIADETYDYKADVRDIARAALTGAP